MNDGTVPFHTNQDQYEDGRIVAERLHEQVNAANLQAQHPAVQMQKRPPKMW